MNKCWFLVFALIDFVPRSMMEEKARRPTKNEKRRAKKKNEMPKKEELSENFARNSNGKENILNVEIEYVSANFEEEKYVNPNLYSQFKSIFEKFSKPEDLLSKEVKSSVADNANNDSMSAIEPTKKLSKKKKKLMSRLSVGELKQLVARPDIVEPHDVSSLDPRLLVYLKTYKNSVPVPRHWCSVRRYLQGKRGIEKVPFQLPEYIAETGIAKIRDAVLERENDRKSKGKAREKMRPKMGRIDIDYQVLHDAFFKYQTKPKMTGHGDLYYEGKEFEVSMKESKPGILSKELMAALGMTETSPPPWLINMQRYGLPPSYPNLKIPGLNAPIPAGAMYGFQPGGWGKPPVDEYGRPLYGDVFGLAAAEVEAAEQHIDKSSRWGVMEEAEEEEEEEEEEEVEQQEIEAKKEKARSSRFDASGTETPMSVAGSLTSEGFDTPDVAIDLRKRAGTETPDTAASSHRELYHVIQEKQTAGSSKGQVFGSDCTYVVPGRGNVQVSINPDRIEDIVGDKERMKDIHDQEASLLSADKMHKTTHIHGFAAETGADAEERRASKKRKLEAPATIKKLKEFKF